ncbi:trigger factor [Mycoplasma nasistruthionis]|uniref:Trigger factor n=1 Tax=Mycoplasma nasistruthionis TaxID=353852 RepID=A0A5B7XVA5_9MOLU|nr:trigger factor [Mycoplasma nasistruthionis]QCZ36809.1 trigger factor [Mycoplasma nasistruthionis]
MKKDKKISHKIVDEKAQLTVFLTVNKEEFEKKLSETNEKLAKNVKVKGFRAGKAPLAERLKYVNPADSLQHVVREYNEANYSDVIEYARDNKLEVSSFPELSFDFDKDQNLVLEYNFVLFPKFDVDVKAIVKSIGYTAVKVTKDDVKKALVALEEQLSQNEVLDKKEKTQLGDTVNIDFKGFIDGEAFEGGEAQGYDLKLGSNAFIPGFEDQLVGKKTGYKGTVKVKFPSEYFVKEYRDKDAEFEVTINQVQRLKLYQLTDENVQLLGDENVKTVKDLEKVLEKNEKVKKFIEANTKFYDQAVAAVLKNSKVVINDSLLRQDITASKAAFENQLKQYGIKKQEYLNLIKSTEQDLEAEFKKQALDKAEKAFAYSALVKDYNVNATPEQIEEFTSKFEQFGFSKQNAHDFVISSLRMSLMLADAKPELAEKLEKDFNAIIK